MKKQITKDEESIPFDDALRRILKAPHIKQERGKKRKLKGKKSKAEKPPN